MICVKCDVCSVTCKTPVTGSTRLTMSSPPREKRSGATSSLSSIWREPWPPRLVRTARRNSAADRESSHLETPPISRVTLSISRVERAASGREMDWEHGQDDSKMKDEMMGDTAANSTEHRLQSFYQSLKEGIQKMRTIQFWCLMGVGGG